VSDSTILPFLRPLLVAGASTSISTANHVSGLLKLPPPIPSPHRQIFNWLASCPLGGLWRGRRLSLGSLRLPRGCERVLV
jgi:hypothetical protein